MQDLSLFVVYLIESRPSSFIIFIDLLNHNFLMILGWTWGDTNHNRSVGAATRTRHNLWLLSILWIFTIQYNKIFKSNESKDGPFTSVTCFNASLITFQAPKTLVTANWIPWDHKKSDHLAECINNVKYIFWSFQV